MNTNLGVHTMSASHFLKETSALLGIFVTLYLWSLIALALQS